jgi:hypothetical protein
MLMEVRGGSPLNVRQTISTSGSDSIQPNNEKTGARLNVKYLKLVNEGTHAVQVFWTKADQQAGTNYFTLQANSDTAGRDRWEGPVELDPENGDAVYMTAASATSDVCATFFQKRG